MKATTLNPRMTRVRRRRAEATSKLKISTSSWLCFILLEIRFVISKILSTVFSHFPK